MTKAWLEGSAVALFCPIGFTADKINLTPPAPGRRAPDGGNRYDCARTLRTAHAAANTRMRNRVTVPTAPASATRTGLQSPEVLLVLAESLAWFRDGDGRIVFANDDNAIRQLQERGLVRQPTPRFHAYEPPGPITSASDAATDDVRIPTSPASFSTQGSDPGVRRVKRVQRLAARSSSASSAIGRLATILIPRSRSGRGRRERESVEWFGPE